MTLVDNNSNSNYSYLLLQENNSHKRIGWCGDGSKRSLRETQHLGPSVLSPPVLTAHPQASGPSVGPLYDFSGSVSSPRPVYGTNLPFVPSSSAPTQSKLAAMW